MGFEHDGWCYQNSIPEETKDARKIVTLKQDGMVWVGNRAWNHTKKRWENNGEPERASVLAWRELNEPARGYWDRGVLVVPKNRGS